MKIPGEEAWGWLQDKYGFEEDRAGRILEIAWRVGPNSEPVEGGLITVTYFGRPGGSWAQSYFEIVENIGKNSSSRRSGKVAAKPPMDYSITNRNTPVARTTSPMRKERVMPPRGRKAAAAPVEPEEQAAVEEAGLYDHHLTKDLSPTMSDYGDWFHENVADIDELGKSDPGRLLALGSTLYPHFQKSDLNQNNREARRAARAASAPVVEEDVEEEAPAKPAARGRAPKATAPAGNGATPKPAAPRGRAKAPAAAAY